MILKITIFTLLISLNVVSQNTFDTKIFGQLILDGKIKYNDLNEDKMFRTLDSLFCKNKKNKDFYFKVANKIQQFSDGVLSEYFSVIARNYYFKNNGEFILNIKKISHPDLLNWLKDIAFDIASEEQDKNKLPEIKKKLDELVLKYKNDKEKQNLIKKCNSIIYKEVEFNLNN